MQVDIGEDVKVNFSELEEDVNILIDNYKKKSMDDLSNQVRRKVEKEKSNNTGPSQKFSIKQFKLLIEELKDKFENQTVSLDDIIAQLDITKDRKVVGVRLAIMADEKRHSDLIEVARMNDKFLIKRPTN